MQNKILFLMPNWNSKSENWMQGIMQSLGSDLKVIGVWNSGLETTWQKKVPVISLTNFVTGTTRILSYLLGDFVKVTAADIIEKAIRKYKINVVIINYGEFALRFIDVWKKDNFKVFVYFHGYDTQIDLRRDDNHQIKYFPKEYKSAIKELSRFSRFIANSQYTKKLLTVDFEINPRNIEVNYPPVIIPPEFVKERRIVLNILHLGRLIDTKSPDKTIEAFEIASKMGMKANLIIAGDGPLKEKCRLLKSKSEFSERITILGAVNHDKALELLKNTDIYTQHNMTGKFTHQTECFGVSILEAMSYAVPVISTKSGGIVESVVNNKTGILINPGDVDAQAEAMIKLSQDEDLRKKMGGEGRKRVIKYFSLKEQSKRLSDIINR